jgi:hypothetical protein
MAKKVQIAKGVKVSKAKEKAMEKRPGGSNVGDYGNVAKGDFAGSIPGSFPINSLQRAKSALKLAHNDKSPSAVKKKVYAKYPSLKKKAKK